MEIGLGLPNAIRGVDAATLLDWAREGDRGGFSTVATTDRIVYPSYESLTVLAAAAAVTERCRLTTAILLAPLRETALLAKQAASVDRLSGGRLTLGLAVGARPDDFRATGADHGRRGATLDAQLGELRRIWQGERRGIAGGIGPEPVNPGGPPIVLGGHSPRAVARAAKHGDGWISGSGGPGMFAGGAAAFRAAWEKEGRQGRPRLLGLAYFSLGPDARENAAAYVNDYYGFAPPYAAQVLSHVAVGEARVAATLGAFAQAGCDELILAPCSADVEQVKLLRAVIDGRPTS